MISITVFGILFGGLMEICQHYIFINRSGNWYDFIANAIGALLGVILYPQLLKLLPLKRWWIKNDNSFKKLLILDLEN